MKPLQKLEKTIEKTIGFYLINKSSTQLRKDLEYFSNIADNLLDEEIAIISGQFKGVKKNIEYFQERFEDRILGKDKTMKEK